MGICDPSDTAIQKREGRDLNCYLNKYINELSIAELQS